MAEPSILGALRDPQFRSDTLRNLVEALNGAKRSLTVGSLGAAGDMGSTLANLVRAGAGTAYHETTGRPIPQALEYRDPARDFGTSASLGNFAEQQGWLPPQTYSMPEQAGALLGPIVAMKAPDLAQSTLRGLVSALKSEPSRRMVEGLVDGMGARPKIFAGEGAKFKPTMQQRLETAQVNAESMLGLPKNNTAIDRAKALGAQPISGIPLEMINAPSKYLDDAYELGMKAKQINPDINKWARGAYEKELGAFPWEMERGPAWEAFFEAGNRGYEKPPVATGYRYGDLPDKGRSWNHRDHIPEYGVSMAEVDHPIAGSWSDPISKMFIEAQGRPRVDVGGYLHPLRTGADGEPLLVGAGKLKGDFKISSGKERSRFAAFDPARRNESDLLAGFAGAGILSPLVLEQLAEPRDKKDKSRK